MLRHKNEGLSFDDKRPNLFMGLGSNSDNSEVANSVYVYKQILIIFTSENATLYTSEKEITRCTEELTTDYFYQRRWE